jgi:quercetin dioxygenase-like cupin family protein
MAAEPQSTEEEAPGTPPPAFKRTDLQRSPSPVSGWEIRQTLVEIPERIESGRHSHPGPEVGYIVRGDVSIEFDDGTALTAAATTRNSAQTFAEQRARSCELLHQDRLDTTMG